MFPLRWCHGFCFSTLLALSLPFTWINICTICVSMQFKLNFHNIALWCDMGSGYTFILPTIFTFIRLLIFCRSFLSHTQYPAQVLLFSLNQTHNAQGEIKRKCWFKSNSVYRFFFYSDAVQCIWLCFHFTTRVHFHVAFVLITMLPYRRQFIHSIPQINCTLTRCCLHNAIFKSPDCIGSTFEIQFKKTWLWNENGRF